MMEGVPGLARPKKNWNRTWQKIKEYRFIYLLVSIPFINMLIFRYYPIVAQFALSFKKYTIRGGLWGSKWVGFQNYAKLFNSGDFEKLLINTLRISTLQILVGFIPPIILAIFLFDLTSNKIRRVAQSIL